VIRLAGALLIEQTDEWLVQRRYLSEESMRLILSPLDGAGNDALPLENEKEATQLNAT
jgi:hypothetical protein